MRFSADMGRNNFYGYLRLYTISDGIAPVGLYLFETHGFIAVLTLYSTKNRSPRAIFSGIHFPAVLLPDRKPDI
jgi:hypothetical protein